MSETVPTTSAISSRHSPVGAQDTVSIEQTVRPLRIALLGYRSNPFSGGQGVYLRCVATGLANRGHQVEVISGQPYPQLPDHSNINLIKLPSLDLYAEESPFKAFRWSLLKSRANFFEWLSMISGGFPEPYTFGLRVKKYFKQHLERYGDTYDVVHDNQTLSPGIVDLQSMGLPLVTTIHHPITFDRDIALAHTEGIGMRLLVKRWHLFLNMQTRVARKLRHIITVSENSRTDIAQSFGVAAQRIKIVYNGIDLQEYSPRSHINRENNLLITTASADQPLKGTQYLLPAFAHLKQEFPNLRMTFIGKPKPGGATEQLIKEHKLESSITFVHGISNKEIVDLYAQATVAVVPSEYEGFGLPAAEAMACEVPVVATNGGALPEVLGDAGLTVPTGNPEALSAAISQLLKNPSMRAQLGAAGRERVKQLFSAQAAAVALEAYYYSMLDK